MFAGIGWTVNGHMAAGAHNDGKLMIRAAKADQAVWMEEPGVDAMRRGTTSHSARSKNLPRCDSTSYRRSSPARRGTYSGAGSALATTEHQSSVRAEGLWAF